MTHETPQDLSTQIKLRLFINTRFHKIVDDAKLTLDSEKRHASTLVSSAGLELGQLVAEGNLPLFPSFTSEGREFSSIRRERGEGLAKFPLVMVDGNVTKNHQVILAPEVFIPEVDQCLMVVSPSSYTLDEQSFVRVAEALRASGRFNISSEISDDTCNFLHLALPYLDSDLYSSLVWKPKSFQVRAITPTGRSHRTKRWFEQTFVSTPDGLLTEPLKEAEIINNSPVIYGTAAAEESSAIQLSEFFRNSGVYLFIAGSSDHAPTPSNIRLATAS